MSNQYSCGCGYNYRRSMPREAARPRMQQPAPSSGPTSMTKCPIAMGYVPMQEWSQPLAPCKGLQIGTIFSDLYKPFCGKGGARR